MNAITLLQRAASALASQSALERARLSMDIQQFLAEQPQSLTGLHISLDDGQTWQASNGVRLSFHDASEDDENMKDLMVNVTTEGIILDLVDQVSGEVDKTACLPVDELVSLTA